MIAAAALALTLAAGSPLHTLVTFDPAQKQTPENLVVAGDGTVYVSLAFASTIVRVTPDGARTMLTVPTRGGITAGLALRREDLYVAVRSPQPAAAGIWRVSHAAFAKAVRVAALPAASFANGLAFDAHGNLYAADSALGRIWRLAPRSRHASVWSAGPALAPTGEQFMGFPLPGANGLKVRRNLVYVSNTSRRTILTVPVRANGSAGRPRVRYTGLEPDDFAFGPGGDLVVAENPPSRLVRVAPNGHVTTLATAADGLDNPSAVAFGPRNRIYVTNAAYFGTRPSLGFLPARPGLGS